MPPQSGSFDLVVLIILLPALPLVLVHYAAKYNVERPIEKRHSTNNAQFPFKMADKTMPIFVPSEKLVKVTKWKVKQGAFVSQGQILFLYNDSSGNSGDLKKYKALRAGTISSIKVKEGDIAEPG